MITLLDVTNNMIATQELYILFFISLNKFLKLLQDQNNYKNSDYYINHINELLKEDKLSISKCSVFIIMAIYNENLSFKYQSDKRKNRHIEKEIINEFIFILSNDIILANTIKKINDILLVNLENYYHNYETHYNCQLTINYDVITEINSENIKDIYENFHKMKRLIILSKLGEMYNIDEIYEIDNHLFCLFYYNE